MSEEAATGLPQGWEARPLSDVARINPPLEREVSGDDAPVTFVPMRAVEAEGGGLTNPEVRPYGKVKRGYTSFVAGDVIMAKITPCMENGKTTTVSDVPGDVCFGSTEFHVVRPETGMSPRWIERFLLQHTTRSDAQRRMAGGVGQMRVPADFLNDLVVPIAPSAEQRRVDEAVDGLLSELDAGIDAVERVQDRLAVYRAAVLNAAVDGSLTVDWRAENPNVEPAEKVRQRIVVERRRRWEEAQLRRFAERGKGPSKDWHARYKEPLPAGADELPSLPKGWCWVTLGQLAWGSGYGTSVKCGEDRAGLPVLRIPNIVKGRVSLENLKFAPSDYVEQGDRIVRPGDLLVVRTNGSRDLIGRGAVVHADPARSVLFASYLIRLRLVGDQSLLRWMSLVWESAQVREWIEARAATSAGQYNISLRVLNGLAVPIPPKEERARIVEVVEDCLSVIEQLSAEFDNGLQAAGRLRQAILRDAFEGKLAAQDRRDAPASELLKSIDVERKARADRAPAGGKLSRGRGGRSVRLSGAGS